MDPDEELPEDSLAIDSEDIPQKSSKAARIVLFVVAIVAFAAAVYVGLAEAVAGLLVFPGIPIVLAWFVWWMFLRRWWRLRKIRHARERRELREAVARRRQ